MSEHALLSPSSAHRWLACPGSVMLESQLPEESSEFAAEGTVAHTVAALCLTENYGAHAYVGRIFDDIEVTSDMADFVQIYVDAVREYAKGGELLVEQRVPIGHVTGEENAAGTSDAIVILDDEIIVIDLKFGRGVIVDAKENDQGRMYALGALHLVGLLGVEPKRVRIVISQPRVAAAPSEWDCTVEDLQAFGEHAKQRGYHALQVLRHEDLRAVHHHLRPGDKQCRFCKAKASCPALSTLVAETTGADFEDVTQKQLPTKVGESTVMHLGHYLPKLDLIEAWCDAIRKRAHAELLAGNHVPGYKLVQGKRGARGWLNAVEAEAVLKSMRLKIEEMYDFKVISPTTAEKLLAKDSPRRWTKLQPLIGQAEGKPTVAPEADPRPPLSVKPVADEFADTAACEDLC